MNIHWSIWILIGLLIGVSSIFLEGFGAFIIVGAIMFFVGVFKFISRPSTPKEITKERKAEGYVKCNNCAAWNYPKADRCHHCSHGMKQAL